MGGKKETGFERYCFIRMTKSLESNLWPKGRLLRSSLSNIPVTFASLIQWVLAGNISMWFSFKMEQALRRQSLFFKACKSWWSNFILLCHKSCRSLWSRGYKHLFCWHLIIFFTWFLFLLRYRKQSKSRSLVRQFSHSKLSGATGLHSFFVSYHRNVCRIILWPVEVCPDENEKPLFWLF